MASQPDRPGDRPTLDPSHISPDLVARAKRAATEDTSDAPTQLYGSDSALADDVRAAIDLGTPPGAKRRATPEPARHPQVEVPPSVQPVLLVAMLGGVGVFAAIVLYMLGVVG